MQLMTGLKGDNNKSKKRRTPCHHQGIIIDDGKGG